MTQPAPEEEPSPPRRRPTPFWLLVTLLALVGGGVLFSRMMPHERALEAASRSGVDGPAGIVELALTSSPAVHGRIVEQWRNGPGQLEPAFTNLELDIGLIGAYVLGLWSLGFWLSGRIRGSARQRFRWRLGLWILLAAAADAGENFLLWRALKSAGSGGAEWAPWIAVLAVAKVVFLLLAVCAVARAVLVDSKRDIPTVDVWVRYLVHLRVSWIGALAVGIGPLWMKSSSLFANTFVLDGEVDANAPLWIGVATGLAAWICVVTAAMTLRLAPVRFGLPAVGLLGVPQPDGHSSASTPRRRWAEVVLALCISAGTGLALWSCNRSIGTIGWFAGGVLLTFGALTLIEWLVQKVARHDGTEEPRRSVRFGFLVEGYLQAGRNRLLPGHLPAVAGVALLLSIFAFMATRLIDSPWVQATPALAMLWFLAALVVAVLAGVSFAFDRFGLPVLLVVGLWSLGSGYLTRSTHYFYLQPAPAPDALAAADVEAASVFERRRTQGEKRNKVVLVCAAGGGIQAAAWTARVLTGLQSRLPWFDTHVGLISSVSGGSVGAMFYVDGRASGADDAQINANAQGSSLNPLSWALVFKDVRRPLGLRIDLAMDRGLALETTWRRRLSTAGEIRSLSSMTGDAGVIPFAFNATLGGVGARDQKGRRLVFSNLDLGADVNQFRTTYGQADIDLATAARMSATFPFATPMARAGLWTEHGAEPVLPDHYLADGGYFDNFGIVTGLDWLAQLRNTENLDVAVLRVVAFPEQVKAAAGPSDFGSWANALLGPVDLLLSTWQRTQAVRSGTELKWLARALDEERVADQLIRFEPGVDGGVFEAPPLSWHLTAHQRRAIEKEWQRQAESQVQSLTRWWTR